VRDNLVARAEHKTGLDLRPTFADSFFMRLGFLLLLMASAVPAGAPAQTPAKTDTARLVSLEVTGSQRFTSSDIAKVVPLQIGAATTKDDLQEAADRLAQLGLFATVQYRFTSVESGLKVEYQVTDTPAVPASFDNFPWFTDDELDAAVKTSVVLFDGNAPEGGAILDGISKALETLIATRGVHAPVSHTLVNVPGSEQRIQLFRIEGPVLKIQSVQFSDDLAKNDRAIQQSLANLLGKPFSRRTFDLFEYEQVRPVYLTHAFLGVKFGRPLPRFAGNPNQPLPDTVVVLAPINPGPVYVWGGADWMGNRAIPTDELAKLIELKPGETADGIKLEKTWQHIRDAYGRRGYLDLIVNPVPLFDDNSARVSYSVSITEGPQYRMGNLVLTGLSYEGEKRIRAAWKIPTGAVFDKEFYEEFLESGAKHAFQGLPVHYEKIGHFLQQDPATGKVDVMLDFQ
jgi:outer membrane protein insertion porin family